jgi:Bifunctional DNA primase/polymerase, N-terminal/KaiC
MNTLDFAREYIKQGFSVFPIRPFTKISALGEGEILQYRERFATDAELVKWFSGNNNIGIICGKLSNLVVVDVDPRNGGKTPHGLPPTLSIKTPSGGWHFYYRSAPGAVKNCLDKNIFPGIDIQSEGFYVVAPPSEVANGTYEMVVSEDPQPFPYEVFKIAPEQKKVNDWQQIITGSAQGSRNETATKVIGLLLSKFPQTEWDSVVWPMLCGWDLKNLPPLGERELRSVFNSISKRELRKVSEHSGAVVPVGSSVVLMSQAAKKSISDSFLVRHPTGFAAIDKAFSGGLCDGNLVLVTGYTGHGKTAFARALTRNFLHNNTYSIWFSFELSVNEMWKKFENMGFRGDSQVYSTEEAIKADLVSIEAKVAEAKEKFNVKVFVIDNLARVFQESLDNPQYRNTPAPVLLGKLTAGIKGIASKHKMIGVLMWQNRRPAPGTRNLWDLDAEHEIRDSSGILTEVDLGVSICRETMPPDSDKKLKNRDDIFRVLAATPIFGKRTLVQVTKNRESGSRFNFVCGFEEETLVDMEGNFPRDPLSIPSPESPVAQKAPLDVPMVEKVVYEAPTPRILATAVVPVATLVQTYAIQQPVNLTQLQKDRQSSKEAEDFFESYVSSSVPF